MSEFMDRARAEAEGRWSVIALGREEATRCRNAFADGAGWAAHQPPTDKEVDAAAEVIYLRSLHGRDEEYPDLPESWKKFYRDHVRAALRAAQKVRAGQ